MDMGCQNQQQMVKSGSSIGLLMLLLPLVLQRTAFYLQLVKLMRPFLKVPNFLLMYLLLA
ncbi:maturase K [Bienertia sinuspersici]